MTFAQHHARILITALFKQSSMVSNPSATKPITVPNMVTGAGQPQQPGQSSSGPTPIQTGAPPLTPGTTAAEQAAGMSTQDMQSQQELQQLQQENQKLQMKQQELQHQVAMAKGDGAAKAGAPDLQYYSSMSIQNAERQVKDVLNKIRKVKTTANALPTQLKLAAFAVDFWKDATQQAPKPVAPPKPQPVAPPPPITTPAATGVTPQRSDNLNRLNLQHDALQSQSSAVNDMVGSGDKWYSPFRALGGLAWGGIKNLTGFDTNNQFGDTMSMFADEANQLDTMNAQPGTTADMDPRSRAAHQELADYVQNRYSQNGGRTVFDNLMQYVPLNGWGQAGAEAAAARQKAIADRTTNLKPGEEWKLKNLGSGWQNTWDNMMGTAAQWGGNLMDAPSQIMRSGIGATFDAGDDMGRLKGQYDTGGLGNVDLKDVGQLPLHLMEAYFKMGLPGSASRAMTPGAMGSLGRTGTALSAGLSGMDAASEPAAAAAARSNVQGAMQALSEFKKNYGLPQAPAEQNPGYMQMILNLLNELVGFRGGAGQQQAQPGMQIPYGPRN